MSVVGLERALHHYTLEPTEQPFDMKSVPLETQPMTEQKAGKAAHLYTADKLIFKLVLWMMQS